VSAPVFVADRALLSAGAEVLLTGPEGHHAAAVRRIAVGERVMLTDGFGLVVEGETLEVRRDEVLFSVLSRSEVPAGEPRLVVVQALPKGDRGEVAVETLTEVGVDVIVPWAASRCVTRWRDERGAKALGRWRSTAREAGKQSRRPWFPEVSEVASTADVARLLGRAALGIVLDEGANAPLSAAPLPSVGSVVVVVGPEGGLSADERDAFARAGAGAYRLGPSVLRTSTAGTVAAAVILAATPRWSPHP